jgi:DNA-binding transcriptional ArsR family regulator
MKLTNVDSKYILKFKALSETTRLKMLPHLSEPRTVKQIADIMKVDHHSLYHHVRVLESAGIVELIKTRQVGNIVEKYYKLTENWVTVPGGKEVLEGVPINPLVQQAVFSMLEDLAETAQAGNESGQVHRIWYKINQANLKEKIVKIEELTRKFIEDLERMEDKEGELLYSFNLVHFKMSSSG